MKYCPIKHDKTAAPPVAQPLQSCLGCTLGYIYSLGRTSINISSISSSRTDATQQAISHDMNPPISNVLIAKESICIVANIPHAALTITPPLLSYLQFTCYSTHLQMGLPGRICLCSDWPWISWLSLVPLFVLKNKYERSDSEWSKMKSHWFMLSDNLKRLIWRKGCISKHKQKTKKEKTRFWSDACLFPQYFN